MGILNITPDSFSDGGRYYSIDDALRRAEVLIAEGASIIDIGGESTRPGSQPVTIDDEIARTVPLITELRRRFDIPISIDAWKSEVAKRAVESGADIINDISGLRFDPRVAEVAASNRTGLVLMHSRGGFGEMHSQPPVTDIFAEVIARLRQSVNVALGHGLDRDHIVLDPGIGFSKTFEQNLQLIAQLDVIRREFEGSPLLVGVSRKSFIGKILGGAEVSERKNGSLAMAAIAAWNGASIVRAHDVRETVEALSVVDSLMRSAFKNQLEPAQES